MLEEKNNLGADRDRMFVPEQDTWYKTNQRRREGYDMRRQEKSGYMIDPQSKAMYPAGGKSLLEAVRRNDRSKGVFTTHPPGTPVPGNGPNGTDRVDLVPFFKTYSGA